MLLHEYMVLNLSMLLLWLLVSDIAWGRQPKLGKGRQFMPASAGCVIRDHIATCCVTLKLAVRVSFAIGNMNFFEFLYINFSPCLKKDLSYFPLAFREAKKSVKI